ncbi:MAG: Protein of unknown function (DUF2894) [Marinobacter excellens HL-55]|uniref:DUF2894 domain-containing protein n=1 Tax=Marinobacter excellens HL-55 TaxID=1305731 RepID=A0A0P8BGV7_9GAMM|nr:MAG: Protein of unknown function (DUF2894) [Marinobacter excellens HL-55]
MTVDTALQSQLEQLRHHGADQLDPIQFHYLEACEHRLRSKGLQHGRHWQKLALAVAEYQASLGPSQKPTPTIAARPSSPLAALLDALNQTTDAPAKAPRSALEQRIFGDIDQPEQTHLPPTTDALQPLKAMARAKADQSTQAIQERIRYAIESTPKDAGPMNAHRLVSRALAEMQRLSPEYLERFARYTDTLMALERLARKG